MKLIKLSCCNCGANLEVNNELKNVHCNYCGQNFLLDDNSIKVECVLNDSKLKIDNALTYLNDFHDYEKAYELFLELSTLNVKDSLIWEGLFRAYTKDFTDLDIDIMIFDDYFDKYLCVEKNKKYIEKYKKLYNEFINEINKKLKNELVQDEDKKRFNKEIRLWTIIGFSFLFCFYTLITKSNEEVVTDTISNSSIVFSVNSEKNTIFVNEKLQMNVVLETVYVDQEYNFKWYISDGILRKDDNITDDGIFSSAIMGEFMVCAELNKVSKCKIINVVKPCQDEYVFELDGASKMIVNVAENGDVCPGTYNAKANFVNDDNWGTEFITIERGYYDWDYYYLSNSYWEKFAVKSGDQIEVNPDVTKLILRKVY